MSQFDRLVRVRVGDERGEGFEFGSQFRITFDVTKTLKRDENTMLVRVYNVAPDTRDKLVQSGKFVTLDAGYENLTALASGDLVRAVVKKEPPDSYLELECSDAARAFRDTRVSLSFAAETPVETVLNAVLDSFDLPVSREGVEIEGLYRNGWSFSGRAADALDKVTEKADIIWSVQDGRIELLGKQEPRLGSLIELTPSTGLIASPEKLEDTEGQTETQKGDGYRVRALLNPKLRPGDLVVLESEQVTRGRYRADSVTFTGDMRGNDWIMEAELYAEA